MRAWLMRPGRARSATHDTASRRGSRVAHTAAQAWSACARAKRTCSRPLPIALLSGPRSCCPGSYHHPSPDAERMAEEPKKNRHQHVSPWVKGFAGSIGGVAEVCARGGSAPHAGPPTLVPPAPHDSFWRWRCSQACALQPMDVIKTRLQLDTAGKYTGILQCGRTIAQEEGTRALWKGLTPFATHLTFKYALRMGSNSVYQNLLRDKVRRHTRFVPLRCVVGAEWHGTVKGERHGLAQGARTSRLAQSLSSRTPLAPVGRTATRSQRKGDYPLRPHLVTASPRTGRQADRRPAHGGGVLRGHHRGAHHRDAL